MYFLTLLIFLQLDAHVSRSPARFDIIGRQVVVELKQVQLF